MFLSNKVVGEYSNFGMKLRDLGSLLRVSEVIRFMGTSISEIPFNKLPVGICIAGEARRLALFDVENRLNDLLQGISPLFSESMRISTPDSPRRTPPQYPHKCGK